MIASTDDSTGAGPSPTGVPTSGGNCSTAWPDEDEIVKRFTPQLNSLAARLCHGNPHLREELVQEGAVGLVHAMRRFDPRRGTQLSTLAQRYMRGRMLNFMRGQRRHGCCVPLQEACWHPDGEDPSEDDCLPVTVAEVQEGIWKFVLQVEGAFLREPLLVVEAGLSVRQREMFELRYRDGLTPSEVARELRVSPARVTQVLSEVVAKVRKALMRN